MTGGREVYLTWDGGEVHLRGHSPGETGLFVSGDGIEGWDSSPDAKVQMTEMQTGDGAHAVSEGDVLYSARTVTINFHAHGETRSEVTRMLRSISEACHRLVRLRVVDADHDTYCVGYVQPGVEPKWWREWATGAVTVVCPDPRRLSTEVRRIQLFPVAGVSGGLFYGDGGEGLVYPLNYGASAETLQNVGTLTNAGTSPAYPVVIVTGPIEGGLRVDSDSGSVAYSQPVGGVQLTLDSLTRTASVAGLDVSRNLTSRGFPVVPAGGSLSVNFQAYGTGWATVEWHDTYI